ncbi:MAG: DNA recombination/repair protein RecA, partial [Thermoleophilum sp.]|nr:DNA recombination/repair protein RecA [Thermoleophilum sp.]
MPPMDRDEGKIAKAREAALKNALAQIERQFGKGSVMRMSDRPQVSVGAISTGSLALDVALGIGGQGDQAVRCGPDPVPAGPGIPLRDR